EPTAAGRGRDHIAPTVDDIEVAGISVTLRQEIRPLAGWRAIFLGGDGDLEMGDIGRPMRAQRDLAPESVNPTRSKILSRFTADEPPAFGIVVVGEEPLDRHLGKLGVAIEGIPVGKSKLGTFLNRVHELGAEGIHSCDIEASEKGEL